MKRLISLIAAFVCISVASYAQEVIRLGIIGLDTSHSTAFTKLLNDNANADPQAARFEVVAAYPYGTQTIESASKRIPKYIEEVKSYGVKIVDSIEELIKECDCIFLETNDGRLHLEQAIPVFKSGKRVYIDKPLGATLGEVIAIYEIASRYNASTFSTSAIRFASEAKKLRNGDYGKVKGADIYSPHHFEPTHPDFGYYGIHGVEGLFTAMGTGCEEVVRMHSDQGDIVVGKWSDGRLGTFRAIRTGPNLYGGTAITEKGAVQTGKYEGYKPLLYEILNFFETGFVPVTPEETIEMFTFMRASNMSVAAGGKPIKMEAAYKSGVKEAKKLLKEYK